MSSESEEQLEAQSALQAAIDRTARAYGFPNDGSVADYLVIFAIQKVNEDGDITERIDQICAPVTTLRSQLGMVEYARADLADDILQAKRTDDS